MPESYSVPGFAWVRRFTVSILAVAFLLLSGVVALVAIAEMDVTVSGAGVVEPKERSHIKSRIAGTIREVRVSSGDNVESGQVVAVLDDTALRTQLEKIERDLETNQLRQAEFLERKDRDLALYEAERSQAHARVETASLQLEQVSREYRLFYEHSPTLRHRKRQPIETLLPIRLREAVFKQSMAELEAVTRKIEALQDGRLELDRLRSEKKKLEQDRFLLRHRIDATLIRSEVEGTILTRETEQLVGNDVKKGEAVLEVAALGRWQVKTQVGELDFPKVRIGQEARIYLEAFPYTEFKVFKGKVAHLPGKVERQADPTAPGASYPVVVSLAPGKITNGERDFVLSYGMKATTKIVIERGSVLSVLWRSVLRSVGRLGRPEIRLAGQGGAK